MPLAYIYARVGPGEDDEVAQTQVDACLDLFRLRLQPEGFYLEPAVVELDDKGTRPWRQRKQGKVLAAALKRGDAVMVGNAIRGWLHLRRLLQQVVAWDEAGIRVLIVDLDMDTGAALGQAHLRLLRRLEVYDRVAGERRTAEAREVLRTRNADRMGGRPPYGYKWGGHKGHMRLIEDTHLRETAQLVVRWRDQEGRTWQGIASFMARWHYRKADHKPWSRRAIRSIYEGEKRWQALLKHGILPTPELMRQVEGIDFVDATT